MTPGELAAVRGRLEEFAAEMFAPLVRRDQRDKGATYVRGLLLDGRRKSMQPMAERLGVDHQGLQQFVSSSTWAVEPVRQRLARPAIEVIAPQAWVVDDTGFPKGGTASPGVARQYSGSLGKVGNCQIGVSICAVTDAASCPLNWRLFLPPGWDDREAATPQDAAAIRSRRARAAIPDEQRHRAKWRLALDMLDELAGWRLAPPVAVADAGYGNNADFRAGIDAPGWSYVLAGTGALTAFPAEAVPEVKPYSGRGRHPLPRYRTKPVGLRAHVLAAGRGSAVELTWREGSRGPMSSHFLALRVRPAGRRPTERLAADGSLPAVWLLAEWPQAAAEPTDYWLSSLPPTLPWPSWSGWPRSAGGSNTTTASARPPSGWTTSRAAPSPAGTGTSPWSPPLSCSSPCCAPTQKRLRRPEPVRGPAPSAGPARDLDRRLHRLRPARRPPTESADLTKHY